MSAKIMVLTGAIVLCLGAGINGYAAGTSSSSWEAQEKENKPVVSLYDQGVEASKNNDFQKAMALFKQALQEDKKNPDVLNMLGHAQLKLGMINESLESYNKALALRPEFPEAREYLGEAYIQAAKREVEILKSYGSKGAEDLEDLIRAFKEAAANL